jgi:hypothetical protein
MNENAYRLLHHGICYRIFSPFQSFHCRRFDQSDLEIEKNESSYPSVPLGEGIFHPLFLEEQSWIRITISTMKIGENIENQRFARRYLIKNVLLLNWQK